MIMSEEYTSYMYVHVSKMQDYIYIVMYAHMSLCDYVMYLDDSCTNSIKIYTVNTTWNNRDLEQNERITCIE